MRQAEENQEKKMALDQIWKAERDGKQVKLAVAKSNSFEEECHRVGQFVDLLRLKLRALAGYISAAPPPLYDRPIVRIVTKVSKNLEPVLTLVQECKRWNLCLPFVIGKRATDFPGIFLLLESSIADVDWLLSIFDPKIGCASRVPDLSLPPIAIKDPVIPWVWGSIATVEMSLLENRIEAADDLALLAQGNDRNKTMIIEEGGVPPLLNLLKENRTEAQIAAANALYILSDDQERVRSIITGGGIPAIVHLLRASPIRVQIQAASLVARLAEYHKAREAFAEERVVFPLVKLLSFEFFSELIITRNYSVYEKKMKINKHNSFRVNQEINISYTNWFFVERNCAKMQKKDWDTAYPIVKLLLKLNCSKALWVLVRGNESISKNITERNGLMCLARLIEKERNEVQFNCLLIVMEVAAVAEQQANFRRSAFKITSPDVRAVIDVLLSVIRESKCPKLQIPAIRSIGSLARIFLAREIRVIESLVAKIRNKHSEVAEEAVIALQKFVCEDNHLRSEHSKSIIKLNGVAALRGWTGKASPQAMVLLGYLGDCRTLERCCYAETKEKIGSSRGTYRTPENAANASEDLTNSKATPIFINMWTDKNMLGSRLKFPPTANITNLPFACSNNGQSGYLPVIDEKGCQWTLNCRNQNGMIYFTDGWKAFRCGNGITVGHRISLYKDDDSFAFGAQYRITVMAN